MHAQLFERSRTDRRALPISAWEGAAGAAAVAGQLRSTPLFGGRVTLALSGRLRLNVSMDLSRLLGIDCQRRGPVTAPRDWSAIRRPESARERHLSAEAMQWLGELPAHVRPHRLCTCHPRIGNRFAVVWLDPGECQRYLDGLMIDSRGSRAGFVPTIRAELVKLDRYYQRYKAVLSWRQDEAVTGLRSRRNG